MTPSTAASEGYQAALVRVCFDAEASTADVEQLGDEPGRWLLYRRMVRARLTDVIRHAFERLHQGIGPDTFLGWIDAFLAMQGPRSRYLRDIPGEFLAFLERHLAAAALSPPPWTLDLAHFEWAELEVAYASDEASHDALGDFSLDRPAVLTPAHRLLRLAYGVHRIPRDEPDGVRDEVAAERIWLCLYRDQETYDVRVLELTDVTGNLLEAMGRGEQSLADCARQAAENVGAVIDEAWARALSDVLSDFLQRGILLGSLG